jgi:hypothetical protein
MHLSEARLLAGITLLITSCPVPLPAALFVSSSQKLSITAPAGRYPVRAARRAGSGTLLPLSH